MRIRTLLVLLFIPLIPVQARTPAKGPRTPEEAFRLLSRDRVGDLPPSRIQFVLGKRPFAIVTMDREFWGRMQARTPSGTAYVRRYDPREHPEALTQQPEVIVVSAPKKLRVVLHAPFTLTALTINGKPAFDHRWRSKFRIAGNEIRYGPQKTVAMYNTIILPGGRSELYYVVS